MTDIVERLCDGTYCTVGCAKLRAEAAAEIERLRGCQEGDAESIKFAFQRNDELRADNERLRAALKHIKDGTWNVGTGEMIPPREYARRALEPKP